MYPIFMRMSRQQANVASYDWSALLYFSEHGEDFEGRTG